jgi:transcription elongation factor Elf1
VSASWQARVECRKCRAALSATAEAGTTDAPSLAIFYCPACGERNQLEVPAGHDPLSVSATAATG